MTKQELLEGIAYQLLYRGEQKEISGITEHMDSRKVRENDAFICIEGARFDSHAAIVSVLKAGAALVVIAADKEEFVRSLLEEQHRTESAGFPIRATIVSVEDVRLAKAVMMANWYDHPAEKMTMIGITGSKGKTTTANMIAEILRAFGHNVGVIGSTGAVFDEKTVELANSTPDSEDVQKYLSQMVKCGCDCAIVECSSQGLMQHRVSGFTFDYGVFLNIVEGDHVSPIEHKDFEEYLRCKSYLLRQCKQPIVNYNDAHRKKLQTLLHSYGIENTLFFADCVTNEEQTRLPGEPLQKPLVVAYATDIEEIKDRFRPQVHMNVGGLLDNSRIRINFPGLYQVTNALAAITVCAKMGVPATIMDEALSQITVKGRLEMVYQSEKFSVCVDFAHNGYSTRNLLVSLRSYLPKRLVCVFGADGNRAKSRRYEMGEASGRLADLSIVTSGHNRYETFEAIFEDIAVGLHKTTGAYVVIPDRKEAIRYAIDHVQDGDLIALIGLGQETYQEENGVKYPYSDMEFVLHVIEEKINNHKEF